MRQSGARGARKAIIYCDYVCPFCFLEIPILERLRDEERAKLDYRAFELRPEPVPTLPPNGEYLTRVWGQSVYPIAGRRGLPIRLPPAQPRSRLAFEGAEFARDAGRLDAYTRAVHEAFFQCGKDIGGKRGAELGITSVPTVIVGDYLIPGAVPFETLCRAVEMMRSGAPTARRRGAGESPWDSMCGRSSLRV
jgi:predicted DsbA family dithiol-disulfide isomerase